MTDCVAAATLSDTAFLSLSKPASHDGRGSGERAVEELDDPVRVSGGCLPDTCPLAGKHGPAVAAQQAARSTRYM